ncbi:MAG: ABC transporter ATP-binding protein, partial [Parasporobacterium sp.]|nr:ABC transporter ATP-binding protein [Parasporobacterium sp.]
PSGSGKTTLLNVVGGLDRYDSGDLLIRGASTKKYKERDWDTYRNHTIGFVFQSYNLIPHQSILSNVELALTLSGVSKKERRKRAAEALKEVGLGDQLHKRPNQMSGGQMQRVAIARALVNNPDVVLADEPTGALDSDTSMQVMELLRQVAKDRLVIMVTHNSELADTYATRIVRLKDGKIVGDTAPWEPEETVSAPEKKKRIRHSSMSFGTALSLSFNNLRTKKARTVLTAFAGSIGIIGIAMILSLSNGVNTYIQNIQKETMTSYPITIFAQTIDLASIMNAGREGAEAEPDHEKDKVYANTYMFDMASTLTTSISENNLTAFKKYLDDKTSPIHEYVGENGIQYSYTMSYEVFAKDPEETFVNTNGIFIRDNRFGFGSMPGSSGMSGSSGASGMSSFMSQNMGTFSEMLPGSGKDLTSPVIKGSYDLLYGSWPESYDEVVLVLDEYNEVFMTRLYELGFLPSREYTEKLTDLQNGVPFENEASSWSYSEACGKEYYLIPACDWYKDRGDGVFEKIEYNADSVAELSENAVRLKISGVVRPAEDSKGGVISGTVGYTRALTDFIIDYTENSPVVKAQRAKPEVNVLTGFEFIAGDDISKAEDAAEYLASLSVAEKADLVRSYMSSMSCMYSSMQTDGQGMDEPETQAQEDRDAGASS